MRSKQRKAKKKAELESAQAAQAQIKREQHQKSKQQANQEADPEAVQLDELIPEKLERPDDALEKAIDFLKPLQLLAKENIETHLLAFEVYSRKSKILLMIQSLKRARSLDAEHPQVHRCLLRLVQSLPQLTKDLNVSVKTVLDKALAELIGTKTAQQLNDEFVAKYRASAEHMYEAAVCMYELDNGKQAEAIKLITSFDLAKVKLEVSLFEML